LLITSDKGSFLVSWQQHESFRLYIGRLLQADSWYRTTASLATREMRLLIIHFHNGNVHLYAIAQQSGKITLQVYALCTGLIPSGWVTTVRPGIWWGLK